MKRLILKISLLSAVVAAFVACQSNDVEISGRFVGLNYKTVYLEQMTATGQNIVDSVMLDNSGCYRIVVKDTAHHAKVYEGGGGADIARRED